MSSTCGGGEAAFHSGVKPNHGGKTGGGGAATVRQG